MGKLEGRVAVVTGGGRGIGQAEALRLAEEGAKVAVLDLAQTDADRTCKMVEEAGGECLALACDVTQRAQVEQAFETVAARWQTVDILVNNAGVTRDNLLFKMSDQDWDVVMDTHLKGSFLCAQAAQKFMVAQRWGKIVNTSSTSALGNRGQANYSTAKAGLQGLTRTLAIELGPFNINVNAVAPGFVESEMTRDTAKRLGMDFEHLKSLAIQDIPLRRVGVPRDIANIVTFLCTDDASFLSGQVLYIRGGP